MGMPMIVSGRLENGMLRMRRHRCRSHGYGTGDAVAADAVAAGFAAGHEMMHGSAVCRR